MSIQRLAILLTLGFLTVVFVAVAVLTFQGPDLEETPLTARSFTANPAPQALRLTIDQSGLIAVSYNDVRSSNLPVADLSAASVRLEHEGNPVPFYVEGEGEGATLYFFAEGITRTVDSPPVYWLAPGQGETMARRIGTPQSEGDALGWREKRWEENANFQPTVTGADSWLGQAIYAPGALEMPLAQIWPTTGPGQLTLRVWSGNQSPAYPDHHLEVWLNGYKLGSHFWDGKKQETIQIPITTGILREAKNVLQLRVPGDTGAAGEAIYLDWIRLEYEGLLNLQQGQLLFYSDQPTVQIRGGDENSNVFDVTDPAAPVKVVDVALSDEGLRFHNPVAGSRYLVANPWQALRPKISAVPQWHTSLRDEARGADYIAIVPSTSIFTDTLQPLLALRRDQGLRVAVIALEQIYDEFAHGKQTPVAIRDFLQYAHSNWQPPAPHFVLLVGDASYEGHAYAGNRKNILPTYLIHTEFAGYVASDTWFTLFEQNELQPVLAIGRLPVQTAEQLRIIVEKTLAYETATSAPWLDRALLVADDEGRFNITSERLAEELDQSGYQTQKLYMTQNEDIHDAIISALNHGVGLVNYAGHGGIDVWGDEKVLQSEDTAILMNGDRLPIFAAFSCINGFFNHPQEDALAEALLWAANGGVVAAVAPSARTLTWQQAPLSTAFYNALLSDQAGTLGDALLQAKVTAAKEPHLGEAIHTLNLLGDPALGFRMPGSE